MDDMAVLSSAETNARSITMEDGLGYLWAMLQHRPRYTGRVPLWTSMALAELRSQGTSADELAARFGVKPKAIYGWWDMARTGLDPLRGVASSR